MKKKSKTEFDIFEDLVNLDLTKEKIDIFLDASGYFKKKLEEISNPVLQKMYKINIFFILKRVSIEITNPEDDKKIAKRTKDIENFIEISNNFYTYMLECLQFLISEQDNIILDCYNEGKIGKEDMIKYLKIAQEKRGNLIIEEKEIVTAIETINKVASNLSKEL